MSTIEVCGRVDYTPSSKRLLGKAVVRMKDDLERQLRNRGYEPYKKDIVRGKLNDAERYIALFVKGRK